MADKLYADRVLETSTTTGTGNIQLDGAKSGGYQTFVAAFGGTHQCYYCIVNPSADEWEIGYGTVQSSTPDFIVRTTILASSNSGSIVNFSSGTKDVFATWPANGGDIVLPVSGQLLADDGTADSPSISFNGDPNTGFYIGGTDDIGVALGGLRRFVFTGDTVATSAGELWFYEAPNSGSQRVSLKSPDTLSANRVWILPQDDPSTVAGYFLTTDASGNLSFAAGGGGINNVVEDTTPQLGGDLDLNTFGITGSHIFSMLRGNDDNFVLRFRSTSPYQNQYLVWDGDDTANRKQMVIKLESSINEAAITTQKQGTGTAPPLYLRANSLDCIKLNTDQSTLFYRLVDMSNVDMEIDSVGTTRADRFKIKNRNANQNTVVHVTPDGSATNSYLELTDDEDLANCGTAFFAIEADNSRVVLGSSAAGTGSMFDLKLKPGNTDSVTLSSTDQSATFHSDVILEGDILGDFANATRANRPAFVNANANQNTTITVTPNGTATTAIAEFSSEPNPDSAYVLQVGCIAGTLGITGLNTAGGTNPNFTWKNGTNSVWGITGSSSLITIYQDVTFQSGDRILHQSGTAALPSYGFSGDTDTGMFLESTAGVIGFSAKGYRAIGITNDGANSSAGKLRFYEGNVNGTFYIDLKAPDQLTAARTWVLPDDDPATVSGLFLTTDASGNLSFAAGSGIGELVEDTTPQLGGDLDSGDFTISNVNRILINDSGATAPEYSFTLDSNSGFYRKGAGDVGVSVEGYGRFSFYATTSSGGTGQLRFYEAPANGTSYIALNAPNSLTSNVVWTLPDEVPGDVAGKFITTDGFGDWYFADPVSGIGELVEDTTPELGGDLNCLTYNIYNTGEVRVGSSSDYGAYNLQVTGDAYIDNLLLVASTTAQAQIQIRSATGEIPSLAYYENGVLEAQARWAPATNIFVTEATGGAGIWHGEDGLLQFVNNSVEAMRLTSAGELWIGSTTDRGGYTLQVTGSAQIYDGSLYVSEPSGTNAIVMAQTDGSNRWAMGKSSVAETGSNAGSDFYIAASDDTGTFLRRDITILRDSGHVILQGYDDIYDSTHKFQVNGPDDNVAAFIRNSTGTANLLVSGRRTGTSTAYADLQFGNREVEGTNSGFCGIRAYKGSAATADSTQMYFYVHNGTAPIDVMRMAYTGAVSFIAESSVTMIGGDSATPLLLGSGRTTDNNVYINMVSSVTNSGTYDTRLIRYSGVNGRTDLTAKGTGGIRLANEDLGAIEFYQNGSLIGEFTTSGNLETTGQILSAQNVAAGVGTSSGADCSAGYNRTADGLAAYTMYADSAAPTTRSAWLQRNAGTNGTLTIANGGTGAMIFEENGSEAFRIDSSQRVLVGTTSATSGYNLKVDGNLLLSTSGSVGTKLVLDSTTGYNCSLDLYENGTMEGAVAWDATGNQVSLYAVNGAYIQAAEGGNIYFGSSGQGAYGRFNTSGYFLVGTTSGSLSGGNTTETGLAVYPGGAVIAARDGAAPLVANRLTSDGMVIDIYQDGTWEGGLSVSGTTVSVTGGHLSRLSQGPDTGIQRGTVMSNIPEMCVWEGEENEQLTKTKVSDVKGDKAVAGVFDMVDDRDELGDYIIAQSGDFIVLVTGPVKSGDLLMSNGDGTAIKQPDDVVRASTVAKAMFDIEDASVQLIPCILMIG